MLSRQARERRHTLPAVPSLCDLAAGEDAHSLKVRSRDRDMTLRLLLSSNMLAGERAVWCIQTRNFLGADLTFSTTRASDVTQPKMQAVSVQTLEGRR